MEPVVQAVVEAVGMIEIVPGFRIYQYELHFTFVRSSGPGGQNVNKTNSCAVLRWNLYANQSMQPVQRERLEAKLASRLTNEGDLLVRSQKFRDQPQNEKDCIEKLRSILKEALFIPKKRLATRPTRSSKEKRLQTKRVESEKKRGRQKKDWQD